MKLNTKIKKFIIGVMLLTVIGVLVGCKESNVSKEKTIVITGSTSVEKILLDMIAAYTSANEGIKINYIGTGSSAGIKDAINGTNSFGVASRELKEEEVLEGITAVNFAYDGIAVITHPSNKIENISLEDLARIYSGQITNWIEIGGDDKEIVVVSREGASGTKAAFEELIELENAGSLSEEAIVVEGNGNVQNNIANNENAIGYVSFSFINEKVKALQVNEVEANGLTAKEGSYKLARPFLYAYREDSIEPEAKAFIEYCLTEGAQDYVEEHGGIRID